MYHKLKLRTRNGIIVFLVIIAGLFIWNTYQINISERPIKPLRPPAIISGECAIEQCHGLDITCGADIPQGCTMEMRIDDFCRSYAHCEKVGRDCRLVTEPMFEECKSCIETCNQEADPIQAFQCAEGCEKATDKSQYLEGSVIVIFNPSTYDQAIELLEKYNLNYRLNSDRGPDSPLFFSVEIPAGAEEEWIGRFEKEQIVSDADFNYIATAE